MTHAQSMKDIHCSKAPIPVGPYPHAKQVGNWFFLSGVGPRLPENNEVPGNQLDPDGRLVDYDITAQCHSVIRNIRNILAEAGCGLEDVVDVTVYLTNMDRDFQSFNEVYAEYFTDSGPCRTTLEVSALPTRIAIELKCIAYLGEKEES